jgi:hypothetical protein
MIMVFTIGPSLPDIGGYGGASPQEMTGLRARYDGDFCHRARNPAGYGGSSSREKTAG